MANERDLETQEFEPENRVVVTKPLPYCYDNSRAVPMYSDPAVNFSGTVSPEESGHQGYYIIKLDAPVYIASSDIKLEPYNSLHVMGACISLFYDRPSLDEIKKD